MRRQGTHAVKLEINLQLAEVVNRCGYKRPRRLGIRAGTGLNLTRGKGADAWALRPWRPDMKARNVRPPRIRIEPTTCRYVDVWLFRRRIPSALTRV